MEKNKKVTILTPCFNGETYIKRFFDSILRQTYKNIEVIFVDDGSKDKTKDIVSEYLPKFKNKKISFKYIYQDNAGQASAVNNGLKYVKGEYITWIDSDDILTDDSIEMRVNYLETHPDINWVRSEAYIVDEENLSEEIGYYKKKNNNNSVDELFEEILFPTNDFYFCPVCYMAKTSALFKVLKNKSIFTNRGGQNWQLMLPLAYNYPCGYINKASGYYVVRNSSHSHEIRYDYEKIINRTYLHEELLVETLKRLNFKENSRYIKKVLKKYNWIRLYESVISKDKKIFKDVYERHTSLNFLFMIFNLIGINDVSYFLIRVINKIKKIILIPT